MGRWLSSGSPAQCQVAPPGTVPISFQRGRLATVSRVQLAANAAAALPPCTPDRPSGPVRGAAATQPSLSADVMNWSCGCDRSGIVAHERKTNAMGRLIAGCPSVFTCHQNGYLSSRGGCQNCWHSLVNCDHGDSTASRFDSPASGPDAWLCAGRSAPPVPAPSVGRPAARAPQG
jgi:hypothetical protein